MIRYQTVTHGFRAVILADHQLAAAAVAHAFHLAGFILDVVAGTALGAHTAACHACFDRGILNQQVDDLIDLDTKLLKRFGLSDDARHTIQNKTVRTVGSGQALLDDAKDDFIRNERTRVHKTLCFQPHRGTVLNGGTQDVAGGNGGDVQLIGQDLGIGAFAGARGAQQDQFHRCSPFHSSSTSDQSPLAELVNYSKKPL